FVYHTVCHKHNFVDKLTQVHTQAIECFNNELKYEIKRRKGVKNNLRKNFLIEFIWFFNHRNDTFNSLLRLIKVN
ncbi:hypothetical protein H311_04840, partial [Anncaliia algerae PRA109]